MILSDRGILFIASYLAAITSLLAAKSAGFAIAPLWGPLLPVLSLATLGLWIWLVAIAFRRYGRAAVWTMLGAPLALYMPAYLALIVLGCMVFGACI